MKRKVLALLLSLVMTATAVPVSAASASVPVEEAAIAAEDETGIEAEAEDELIENTMAADKGEVKSIDTYKTSTAAGVAPILPDSVVANGLVFDTPTESVKSSTKDFDFGEEFNSKLIPVKWEAVDAAKYAAAGKSFTVKGTATYDGKDYDATAEITVNEPAAPGASNSSVTFENVQLTDDFWAPKQETNATTSLDKAIYQIEQPSGGEPNFDNAIKRLNGESYAAHQGFVFQDTDIYKSIESLSYTLSDIQNDTSEESKALKEKLQNKLNTWIEKIEKVQYADGYIGTYFTLRATHNNGNDQNSPTGTHRWRNFSSHEMYNAGHFLEAVCAYTRYREGIGDPDYRLYVAGKRFADEIVSLFGPEGTRHEVPGHEEIELALVKFGKLAETYEGADAGQKYYDTAKTLIDRRGEDRTLRESGYKGYTYSQDSTPLVEEVTAKGHSVRANYYWTGATDVATMLPDNDPDKAAYMKSLSTIWDAVAHKKTYITGGIGTTAPSADSEGFGDDYILPNDKSYCEICAAIAAANWNQRMNLLYEDGKYADMVEKNLYNSILVGTNLEGNKFYYSTLLEAGSGNQRSDWFYCACCPPNLMRTIASVSGYMYSVHNDNLFVNMYIGSNGKVNVNGTEVALAQETNYPWDGAVKLTVDPAESKAFTMKVRIPGWVEEQVNKEVSITVNGEKVTAEKVNGYVAINRTWNKGDVVMIDIPMEIRKTEADPNVVYNEGRIALQRGPIVYSLEKAGNKQLNSDIEDFSPLNIVIPRDAKLKATYNKDLLKGVVEITGEANYVQYGELIPIKIQAIPYYAWNNRGDNAEYVENGADNNNSSQMLIWTMADEAQISETSGAADDAGPSAEVSSDYVYGGARIDGVHMDWEPEASNLGNGLGWSNWSVAGGSEHWLQYDWDEPVTTNEMQFYWFDNYDWDRSPGSLIIQYKDENGNWKDATKKLTDEDGVFENDKYNVVKFDTITSTSMRLLMTVRTEPSTVGSIGCYRWKVMLDKEGVSANVAKMIDQIGTVESTSASKKLIYAARKAYNSLTDEMKAMVNNYAVLEAAEKTYEQLTKEAAAPVIAEIDKIGTVEATEDCKVKIDAARKAYDALNRQQRARVTNYKALSEAEEKYAEMAGNVDPDKEAAVPVIEAIDKIGTVAATEDCKAKIDAARKAYDALTDAQKGYVTNYKVLTDAEAMYADMQKAIEADKEAAANVDALIDAIGAVEATDASKAKIDAAKDAYNALTDAQKAYVTKLEVLEAAEKKYTELTPDVIDIAKASVSAIAAQYYTGKALTPAVSVSYDGKALAANTDYAVSYSSNINIGTAKVTITGKGKYTGTQVKTFTITVKKNSVYTVGGYKYKVTNAKTDGNGIVTVAGAASKSLKKIKVASAVKIGGKSFKITQIAKKAFAGCKKAKAAVIGKNVTKIGAQAFYNCKALKKITVKSTNLKKVGKKALKNINKKAVIKVPKKQLKKYKNKFKSKGQAKSVKIK